MVKEGNIIQGPWVKKTEEKRGSVVGDTEEKKTNPPAPYKPAPVVEIPDGRNSFEKGDEAFIVILKEFIESARKNKATELSPAFTAIYNVAKEAMISKESQRQAQETIKDWDTQETLDFANNQSNLPYLQKHPALVVAIYEKLFSS